MAIKCRRETIQKAIVDLYGSYDKIPEDSRVFIEAVYNKEDLHDFYRQCREIEQENKDTLVEFQEDYPGVLNGDNLADVLKAARAKKVMPAKRKNEIYKHFFEKLPRAIMRRG